MLTRRPAGILVAVALDAKPDSCPRLLIICPKNSGCGHQKPSWATRQDGSEGPLRSRGLSRVAACL